MPDIQPTILFTMEEPTTNSMPQWFVLYTQHEGIVDEVYDFPGVIVHIDLFKDDGWAKVRIHPTYDVEEVWCALHDHLTDESRFLQTFSQHTDQILEENKT